MLFPSKTALQLDLWVAALFLSVCNWKKLSDFETMMARWLFPFMAGHKIFKDLWGLESYWAFPETLSAKTGYILLF